MGLKLVVGVCVGGVSAPVTPRINVPRLSSSSSQCYFLFSFFFCVATSGILASKYLLPVPQPLILLSAAVNCQDSETLIAESISGGFGGRRRRRERQVINTVVGNFFHPALICFQQEALGVHYILIHPCMNATHTPINDVAPPPFSLILKLSVVTDALSFSRPLCLDAQKIFQNTSACLPHFLSVCTCVHT